MAGNFQFEITPLLNLEQVRASVKEAKLLIDDLRVQNSNFAAAATNPITAGIGGVHAAAAADANAVQAQIQAAVAEHIRLLQLSDDLLFAEGEAEIRLQRAQQLRTFASSDAVIAANAELALSKRAEAAATKVAINNRLLGAQAGSEDEQLLLNEAKNRVQQQVIAANEKLADLATIEAAGREEYVSLLAEATAGQAVLAAEIRAEAERLKAGDSAYAQAQATATRANLEQSVAAQEAAALQDEAALLEGEQTVAQLKGQEAYTKQISQLEARVETQNLLLAGDQRGIELQAEANILQEQINIIRKAREGELAATLGIAAPGTGGGDKGGTGGTGGGVGFLGGGLGGIAKFALGAAAFITVSKGITETLKEASELQTQFSILQTQLEATDRAGDFSTLKAGLFSIGKEVGVETSELAKLAIQITGAFQNEQGNRGTPQFALQQVKSAAEIQKLYGLSNAEITNGVTALAYTFDTTFEKIGDKAAGLQARFGVTSRELITSISQIAPVAKEMGLSFDQLSVISASAERETGRTGVSVTEALGRVLPNIAQHTEDVLSAYQGNAALAGSYNKIVKDIASGESGKVLIQLINDWDKLGQVQRDALLSSLGGGRQAPQLAAVFGDPQLINELNKPIDDTGKLNDQFAKLQNTIGQVFDRFKQSLVQIGVALSEAGVLPVLKDIVNVLETFTALLGPLIGLLGNFKEALNIGGLDLFSKAIEGLLVLKGAQLGRGLFAAGAAGAGPGGTGLSGGLGNLLTFGLLKNRGTPVADGEVAAQTGVIAGTKQYASGFYTAFIQRMNNFIRSPGALATAGLGVAGIAAGQIVGGDAGKTLTAVGSGLTIAAVTGNPLIGVVVAGAQLLENFLNTAKEAQAKTAELTQKYAGLSEKKLIDIATSGDQHGRKVNAGGFQGFAGQYLNTLTLGATDIQVGDSESDVAGKELQERSRQRFIRYAETIQRLTVDPKLAKDIQKELSNDKDDPDKLAEYVLDLFKKINNGTIKGLNVYKIFKEGNSKALSKFEGALSSGDQEAAGDAGQSLLDKTKANYEKGTISGQAYINQLESRRNSLLDVLNTKGDGQKNVIEKINKYDAEISDYYSNQVKKRLDALRSIREAQGLNIDDSEISANVEALKDSKFTDPSKRAEVAANAVKGLKEALQREEDGVKTAAEKLVIEQRGRAIPDQVKLTLLQPLVDDALNQSSINVQRLAAVVEAAGGGSLTQFEERIVAVAEFLGISVYEATKLILEDLLKNTYNQILALSLVVLTKNKWNAEIQKKMGELNAAAQGIAGQLSDLEKEGTGGSLGTQLPQIGDIHLGNDAALAQQAASEAQAAADKAAEEARALASAQADLAAAYVERDPVAAALASINAADVQYANAQTASEQVSALAARVRAQHAYEDAINAITNAQLDLVGAWVEHDPLLSARVQLTKAQVAYQQAGGEAERLQALAQEVAAQHAIEDAMHAIFDSQINLAKAMAQAMGDMIGVAQEGLKEAQSAFYYAISSHAGDAAINDARAQIISAEAALRDAQLKDKEDTIDFNLQTHQISTAQAIAQYQALLSNADILQLTTQERRDLILKIQQLKGDLQKDLQFDLPTDLRLPTLYEARRLDQSGGNYQDNRVISVSLSSTDPASTQAAVTQIQDALNAPAVFGSGSRIY